MLDEHHMYMAEWLHLLYVVLVVLCIYLCTVTSYNKDIIYLPIIMLFLKYMHLAVQIEGVIPIIVLISHTRPLPPPQLLHCRNLCLS